MRINKRKRRNVNSLIPQQKQNFSGHNNDMTTKNMSKMVLHIFIVPTEQLRILNCPHLERNQEIKLKNQDGHSNSEINKFTRISFPQKDGTNSKALAITCEQIIGICRSKCRMYEKKGIHTKYIR